jgi:hypothetical protein
MSHERNPPQSSFDSRATLADTLFWAALGLLIALAIAGIALLVVDRLLLDPVLLLPAHPAVERHA